VASSLVAERACSEGTGERLSRVRSFFGPPGSTAAAGDRAGFICAPAAGEVNQGEP